jgi:hypothetical protein
VIRLLQRLAILGLGALSVWLIVFVVFRIADNRLPSILALSATYGIGAYVILPRVVRMSLKISKRQRVPRYTITGDGLPGDPVNVALTGTLSELRAAFAAIGWMEADRLNLKSSIGMARPFVFNQRIPGRHSARSIFRSRPGHRFAEGDRRQPAQATRPVLALASGRRSPPGHAASGSTRTARPTGSACLGRGRHQGHGHRPDEVDVPDHPRHRRGHECGARVPVRRAEKGGSSET